MSERTDYSALIERLVAGGPDRELDNLIGYHIDKRPWWVAEWGESGESTPGLVDYCRKTGVMESGPTEPPPPYTSSIDAALALVERCLGRRDLSINYTGTAASQRWACTIRMDDNPAGDRVGQSDFFPAIAILIALLRALENPNE